MRFFVGALGLAAAVACACEDPARASAGTDDKMTACDPRVSRPVPSARGGDAPTAYEQAAQAEKAGRIAEALALYALAARRGEGAAAVRLSQIYDAGAAGVSRDPHESIRWLIGARMLNHEVPGRSDGATPYELGRRAETMGKGAEAVKHYLASARSGFAPAAARLSDIYDAGMPGVRIDYDAAARWHQTAYALSKLPPAQTASGNRRP